jgi:potassium-dependent mechanosensitive channel
MTGVAVAWFGIPRLGVAGLPRLDLSLEPLRSVFTAPLFQMGGTSISIASIIQLLLLLVSVAIASRWLRHILAKRLLARLKIDANNREAIATIISYSLGFLGFLVILQTTGFNLAAFTVLAGGLGVGLGLGLQDITINFISGITLLLTRKLRVGDFVQFDGTKGYIEEVSLQSTVVRTRSGSHVIVPNRQLVDKQVTNLSYDTFGGRLEIAISVAEESDLVLVTELLLACAYGDGNVLSEPPPKVIFSKFSGNALDLELWVWVSRVDRDFDLKSNLYFAIEHSFRENGVMLPYPQVELWRGQPRSVKATPGADQRDRSSLRAMLGQISYFKPWSAPQIRHLIETGCPKRLIPNEILFEEGEPGDSFYIVLAGRVEVYSDRINKQLAILGPGQFLGELSLILGVPRTASVRALEHCRLFVIHQPGFETLLAENPQLGEAIMEELAHHQEELRLRRTQMIEMGILDSESDPNPLVWARHRLQKLFRFSS